MILLIDLLFESLFDKFKCFWDLSIYCILAASFSATFSEPTDVKGESEAFYISNYFDFYNKCFNGKQFLLNCMYLDNAANYGTLLHCATSAKMPIYCQVLIDDGFNFYKKNKSGVTCLRIAQRYNYSSILERFTNTTLPQNNDDSKDTTDTKDEKSDSSSTMNNNKSNKTTIELEYFKYQNQKQIYGIRCDGDSSCSVITKGISVTTY